MRRPKLRCDELKQPGRFVRGVVDSTARCLVGNIVTNTLSAPAAFARGRMQYHLLIPFCDSLSPPRPKLKPPNVPRIARTQMGKMYHRRPNGLESTQGDLQAYKANGTAQRHVGFQIPGSLQRGEQSSRSSTSGTSSFTAMECRKQEIMTSSTQPMQVSSRMKPSGDAHVADCMNLSLKPAPFGTQDLCS